MPPSRAIYEPTDIAHRPTLTPYTPPPGAPPAMLEAGGHPPGVALSAFPTSCMVWKRIFSSANDWDLLQRKSVGPMWHGECWTP